MEKEKSSLMHNSVAQEVWPSGIFSHKHTTQVTSYCHRLLAHLVSIVSLLWSLLQPSFLALDGLERASLGLSFFSFSLPSLPLWSFSEIGPILPCLLEEGMDGMK